MRALDRRGHVVETEGAPVMPVATATATAIMPTAVATSIAGSTPGDGGVDSSSNTVDNTANPIGVPSPTATVDIPPTPTTTAPTEVAGMLSDADFAKMASSNTAAVDNGGQDFSELGERLL